MTMRPRITLIVTAASLAASLIALIAVAQTKLDRVVKRDGTTVAGHVKSVDETNVLLDGNAIPRSEVRAILFAGAKRTAQPPPSSSGTPPTGTNLTDLVTRSLGGNLYGHVSQVTESLVIQNGKQLPRSSVASIQFNVSNPGQVITVFPSPSPSPSPSGSPGTSSSPSPSTSPDTSGGGGKSDQPSGGNTSGSAGDRTSTPRPTPPWIGECDDKNKTDTVELDAQPTCNYFGNYTPSGPPDIIRCEVTVHFCGRHWQRHTDFQSGKGYGDEALREMKQQLGLGTRICCEKLEKARGTKQPCDPSMDLDCDNVPNQNDDFPFDPNCSSWKDPCADKYKKKP